MTVKRRALETKVRALYGLLKEEKGEIFRDPDKGLKSIMSAKTIEDSKDGNKISLADFESKLKERSDRRISSLKYYMDKRSRDFVEAYLLKEELDDLRIYIGLLVKTDRSDLNNFVDRSPYSELLNFSRDMDIECKVFLKSLVKRPYYRILEPYTEKSEEEIKKEEIYLSVNLEKWYFQNLRNKLKALKNDELKKLVAGQIDWANIQWIYRARNFRDLDPMTIGALIIEGGLYFSRDKLREISSSAGGSRGEILDFFNKSPYAKKTGRLESMSFFTIIRQRYFIRPAERMIYASKDSLSRAVSYIILQEAALADFCRIAEAKSLNLPEDKLEDYLIYSRKEDTWR